MISGYNLCCRVLLKEFIYHRFSNIKLQGLFILILFASLSIASVQGYAADYGQPPKDINDDGVHPKLLITFSMHNFPFYRNYDDFIDYSDRPMSYDPTMPYQVSDSLKLTQAINAGVDLYCQTNFYADGSPAVGGDTKRGIRIIQRLVNAAHGRNIKIAPEIVGVENSEKYGMNDLADYFQTLVDLFFNDPSIFKYDGKMVVFLWKPFNDNNGPVSTGFTPEKLQQVWDLIPDVRAKIHVVLEDYYLIGATSVAQLQNRWDDTYIQRLMAVGDNMFYWYSTSDLDIDAARKNLLATWLRNNRSNVPVIGSLLPGYFRKNTGGLNPFHSTLRARKLWESTQSIQPDWVHLYSWDDYSESGMWEPTRNNRGLYARLINTLSNHWKELPQTQGVSYWIGTPQSIQRGQELYIEVIQLVSPSNIQSNLKLSLNDGSGNLIYESLPSNIETDADNNVIVYMFSINTATTPFTFVDEIVPKVTAPSLSVTNGIAPIKISIFHWRRECNLNCVRL